MPLKFIRNDITKVSADVIVNSANPEPVVSGGCDYAVYEAAGMEELLEARRKIGPIGRGQAAATPAFSLSADYIIHTVGPEYRDGKSGEEALLASCYENSLQLAKELSARSIAFPLISTGVYGYPKEEALKTALSVCQNFLFEQDMVIFLVLFDEPAYALGGRIADRIESFISDHEAAVCLKEEYRIDEGMRPSPKSARRSKRAVLEEAAMCCSIPITFEELVKESFQRMLFRLIEEKGFTANEVRLRANITKQTFSKIRNNPDYRPKKDTAFALAIGLCLSFSETQEFLSRAGFAFNPSDKRDWVIRYFIEQKLYDLSQIDAVLEDEFDMQPITYVPAGF